MIFGMDIRRILFRILEVGFDDGIDNIFFNTMFLKIFLCVISLDL